MQGCDQGGSGAHGSRDPGALRPALRDRASLSRRARPSDDGAARLGRAGAQVRSVRAIAIVGPTASGKTRLSVPVARELGAEIISMDSRQVYRGMDVGTAKIAVELRKSVPHYGLDLVRPDESYSAGRFARDARCWVAEIRVHGKLPLLVGGTGFFLKALTHPVFREPDMELSRRGRVRRWLGGLDRPELARWASVLDPERATLAAEGGRQRLARTLEVPLLTGRSLSWWHRQAIPDGEALDVGVVVLSLPRDDLGRRIDARVDEMFRGGLLEEVRCLLDAGFSEEDPGMTGTGYREAARVVRGELQLVEAVELVRRATRRYARRQLTWFRHQLPEPYLTVDGTTPIKEQIRRVVGWWKGIEAGVQG
ncbi:MAG: tRNA (adenosine(37)-N6)-dimethylallyltransferase MiaA [Gemmatimonadetes bacterium]|nr:tRNA (adenosine(37)-N6)-dimethylallyltransferase MiaA [Gemmatimonadota bacterium]